LGNLVTAAHQSHKLHFSYLKGSIGHHIEKADVQLADVLAQGVIQIKNFLTVALSWSKVGRGIWATKGMVNLSCL
jgi:hypothetical protein